MAGGSGGEPVGRPGRYESLLLVPGVLNQGVYG